MTKTVIEHRTPLRAGTRRDTQVPAGLRLLPARLRSLVASGLLAWVSLLAPAPVAAAAATAAETDPVAASATPLSEDEVLASAGRHFPQILERLARQRAALGRERAAAGAFDLVFGIDAFERAAGFYDGVSVETKVYQPLRSHGASLYGGWQISDGDFPIYEDDRFTNTGGRFKVGVLFSLLRDRDIDERRFGVRDARIATREAELDVLLTRIGVQQRALAAYWSWVATGRELQIYEELLRIAIERQTGLEQRVRAGAVASVFLTENLQNITRRQTLEVIARRAHEAAANSLSFYHRSADGTPLLPARTRLPAMRSGDPLGAGARASGSSAALARGAGSAGPDPRTGLEALFARRPELRVLAVAMERLEGRVALAENALQPRVDLSLEVGQPLGAVAEGGRSRDETEAIVGLTVEVPLQRRLARGKLDVARAELDAARYRQRFLEDEIDVELRNILLGLRTAQELLALAAQDMALSEQLMIAEQRRFDSGASDFFLVNVREEAAADARIRHVRAALDVRLARVELDAATVNLARLRIDSASVPPAFPEG